MTIQDILGLQDVPVGTISNQMLSITVVDVLPIEVKMTETAECPQPLDWTALPSLRTITAARRPVTLMEEAKMKVWRLEHQAYAALEEEDEELVRVGKQITVLFKGAPHRISTHHLRQHISLAHEIIEKVVSLQGIIAWCETQTTSKLLATYFGDTTAAEVAIELLSMKTSESRGSLVRDIRSCLPQGWLTDGVLGCFCEYMGKWK